MKWEDNVRKVVPYVAGEQPNKPKMIKLNTNECPYPPAPGVAKALEELNADALRLYPDPNTTELITTLAEYYGVEPEQVFVGVGSDDVLSMAFLTFFNSDEPILFPDITYSFYDVWADLYRIPYKTCALDEQWHIRPVDYMQENGGVIFPNPNAPTAIYENLDFVEDILEHNQDVIVIVDEAYIDFAGKSAIELIDKYENLIIVQTFSKARSMAGMRIGYAISNPTLIKYLNDAKYSFNSYTMNQTSLICGVEAVKDKAYFEEHVQKIVDTREWAKEELRALGFEFPDSKSNFIFVTHPKVSAKKLFEALKNANIYVRFLGGARIQEYLRISIGTREEMETLISFLKEYMKENKGEK